MNPNHYTKSGTTPNYLDQIPDTPHRLPQHRRAHSDTFFRFTDDLLFDVSDLSALDHPTNSPPPPPTESNNNVPMTVDSSKSDESSSDNTGNRVPNHLRSLSVDADFFDGLSFGGGEGGVEGDKRIGGKHRYSNSMDGFDGVLDGVKKAMAPEKLAELALIDPKRAKRILANRQSAARSKERKVHYTNELERKVQMLQTEATTLSAQVTMLQRDTAGMNAENRELKLRLQAMEQQAQLRDALNETLREEVQRLRITTGQVSAATCSNGVSPSQFSLHPQGLPRYGVQQNQQAQQQQQPQQTYQQQQQFQMPASSNVNQTGSRQLQSSFLDYMQR